MTTEKWLIWDLDGVLVDTRHRIHHIKDRPGHYFKPDWKTYVSLAGGDSHYDDVAQLLWCLRRGGFFHMAVVTGRMENEGENTREWLAQRGMLSSFEEFHFRKEGDFRRAPDIKLEVVKNHFLHVPNRRLVAVFEDHPGTVEALRAVGVTCLHVREYL